MRALFVIAFVFLHASHCAWATLDHKVGCRWCPWRAACPRSGHRNVSCSPVVPGTGSSGGADVGPCRTRTGPRSRGQVLKHSTVASPWKKNM